MILLPVEYLLYGIETKDTKIERRVPVLEELYYYVTLNFRSGEWLF